MLGGRGGAAPQMGISSSGIWGVDIERHLSETGMQPGIVQTPARVMEAPLFDARWSLGGGGGGGGGERTREGGSGEGAGAGAGAGLERERVVGVDCSRYFSIAVTDKGGVWTFGASYSGALAQGDVSWSTSARRVEGPVAAAIAAEGGAVAVAAGGAGAAWLTARCAPRGAGCGAGPGGASCWRLLTAVARAGGWHHRAA